MPVMTPRFVVRELHGWAIRDDLGGRHPSHSQPGLTVTVHDMAYCARVVGVWRSERRAFDRDALGRWYGHSRATRFANMRREARALAASLNAREAAACP